MDDEICFDYVVVHRTFGTVSSTSRLG